MKTKPSGRRQRANRPVYKARLSFARRNKTLSSSALRHLNQDSSELFPIVGIGASAGGLEAMTQLLRALPGQTGMAFVLVQHLDPTHESALTALLSRFTSMVVREAKRQYALQEITDLSNKRELRRGTP